MNGVHSCPGCHRPNIPNRLYACRSCWGQLPRALQRDITRTASGLRCRYPLERWDVLQAAADFYAAQERSHS